MKIEIGLIAAIQAGLVGLAGWLFKDMKNRVNELESKVKTEDEIRQIIHDKLDPIRVTQQNIKEDVSEIKEDVKTLIRSKSD